METIAHYPNGSPKEKYTIINGAKDGLYQSWYDSLFGQL
jgi:antitoxin component YwqK of YwqJK toxin-antitoxin module